MAKYSPVSFFYTRYTLPKVPRPITFSASNESLLTTFTTLDVSAVISCAIDADVRGVVSSSYYMLVCGKVKRVDRRVVTVVDLVELV